MKRLFIALMSVTALLIASCNGVEIEKGEKGASAYDVWVEGVKRGSIKWDKSALTIADFFKYLKGIDGANGVSAYAQWKQQIATGTVANPHNKNEKWSPQRNTMQDFWIFLTGATGERGAQGETGDDGIAGEDGKDGRDGQDMINAADGVDGKDGADGKNGKDGENGKDGTDGKTAKMVEMERMVEMDKMELMVEMVETERMERLHMNYGKKWLKQATLMIHTMKVPSGTECVLQRKTFVHI